MKNYILLFLFLCLCFSSQGQNIPIDSFYVRGTTWTEAVTYDSYSSGYHIHNYGVRGKVFRIEGDTIVSGVIYHQLSVMEDGGYGYSSSLYTGTTSFGFDTGSNIYETIGRIRVDSEKVYFTRDVAVTSFDYFYYSAFPIGVEYLIYDFNIGIGSVIISSGSINSFAVSSIDSVAVSSGMYLKKYIDSLGNYWIRGIGSNGGFLFSYALLNGGPLANEYNTYTLCYDNPSFSYHFQYSSPILLGQLQNNCFDIVASLDVPKIGRFQNSITVYPNPTGNDYLHFTGDDLKDVNKIIITDAAGRLIYAFLQPFTTGEKQLYVPLAPGVYFAKFEFNDHMIIEKKIIKL